MKQERNIKVVITKEGAEGRGKDVSANASLHRPFQMQVSTHRCVPL